jgi:hypothetical protein
MVAHTIYQAEMGFPVECGFRRTPSGQPTVKDLVKPGDIVATSYETGPYRVDAVYGPHRDGYPSHFSLGLSLIKNDGGLQRGHFSINELVAVNGRILKLFENNDDEVFIKGRYDSRRCPF